MREDLKELLETAEEDLEAAKGLFKIKKYRIAAFHCQQAVEKYLKAYLMERKGSYPFIHSISRLLHEILEVDKDFEYLSKTKVYKLDKFYVGVRYPPLLKISEEEVKEALEIAEKVKEFVLEKLKYSLS